MSFRFKSIDFTDFYIKKISNPAVPIPEGVLDITYMPNIYIGDSPRKIAELLMTPYDTDKFSESDFVYELTTGDGDVDNDKLYIVGRDVFSAVEIENFDFRVGARHITGYLEEVNASIEYENRSYNLYTSLASSFDGTGTNYLSSDGEAFGIEDEISFGAWVNMDEYVAPEVPFDVNSANLNGVDQKFTYSDTQNITGVDATFCYLLKSTEISATRRVFHGMREDGSNFLLIELTPTGLHIENWDEGSLILDQTLAYTFVENTWYGIVLSQVSGVLRLYVNGVLVGNFSSPISNGFTTPNVTYGAYPTGLNFQGSMSFVSYNRNYGYSQSDVSEWYNNGIIKCYDERSSQIKTGEVSAHNLCNYNGNNGTELLDQNPNGSNLTNVGSTSFNGTGLQVECSEEPLPLFDVNTISLNGTNQWASVPYQTFDFTSDFSASIRFKTSDVSKVAQGLIGQFGNLAEVRSWTLHILGDKLRVSYTPDGNTLAGNILNGVTTLSNNTWYTATMTVSALNEVKLYLNGSLENTLPVAFTAQDVANDVGLGAYIDVAQYGLFGELGFPRIWSRTLTPSEVNEEYRGNIPYCYDELSTGLKNSLDYSTRLGNWDTNAGQELVDHSPSGLTTTVYNSPSFNGTGLQVECEPIPITLEQGIIQKGEIDTEGYTMSRRIENGENLIDFNLATGTSSVGTFAVDSIDLNATSQYLQLQNSSYLELGNNPLIMSFWADTKTSSTREKIRVYYQGDGTDTDFNEISNQFLANDSFVVTFDSNGTRGQVFYDDALLGVEGWAHVLLVYTRLTDTDSGTLYINGVEYTGSITWNRQDAGWSSRNYTFINPVALGAQIRSTTSYAKTPVQYGVSFDSNFTQADATYLYNNGTPLCWDGVETDNPTLYAKFEECFDLGTFNGSTETQALTGHKNGWVFDNINSAPFTDQGLQVECETTSLVPTTISSTDIATGQWKFLVATYNNVEGLMRLYVDGTQVAVSANIANDMIVSTNDLLVGNLHSLDKLFQGCMMFPFVANKKFIDSQISLMYNGGNPLRYEDLETDTDVTTDMIGHWNLADWNNGAHTGDELVNNADVVNNLVDNGSIPFDCTGADVASNEPINP